MTNRKNASKASTSATIIANLPATLPPTIASADAALEASKGKIIDGEFVELDKAGNMLNDSDAEGNSDEAKALASVEAEIIKARDAKVGAGKVVDNDGSGLPRALRALSLNVPKDANGAEIAKAIGADFSTFRLPLTVTLPNGVKMETGEYAHFRDTDNGMLVAHASDTFQLPNVAEFFDGFRSVIDTLGEDAADWRAGIMAPGNVTDGARGLVIFGTVKAGEPFMAAMDEVNPYAFLTASLKFGLASRIGCASTIPVCENTFMAAYHESGNSKAGVSYGHRSEFGLEQIEDYIQQAEIAKVRYIRQAEFLASIAAKPEMVQLFFANIFPQAKESTKGKQYTKRAGEAFMLNMLSDSANNPGAAARGDTWWKAFNTVTRMADHDLARTDDTRVYNSFVGNGRLMKQRAMDTALTMAGNTHDELWEHGEVKLLAA